jgi:hypothetical protein
MKSLHRLLGAYQKSDPVFDEDQLIRVNQVIGKAALIYEKVRNAIDYRDEHLLRKNAVLRILKRKLFIEKILINQTLDKLALQIVQEMIRAGYLKNNAVPKSKVKELQVVLEKYQLLAQRADLTQKEFTWLLDIQACEIEEVLAPPTKDMALIRFAYEAMNTRIITNQGEIENKEKELQVFLAVHRALRKADAPMLSLVLWRLFYPQWNGADEVTVSKIAQQFVQTRDEIEEQLNHPWRKQLMRTFKRWAIVFWTLEDVIEKDPHAAAAAFSSEESLELAVNKALEARYKGVRKRLRTGVIRSIIYVFFTKMLLALLIELPLDQIIEGAVNYFSLTINIFFPPVLMFMVAITIRTPGKKNTEMVIKELKDIVFEREKQQNFRLKAPKKRSTVTSVTLNVLYLAVFAVIVYFIFNGLHLLGFNWVSAGIFILFLSIVSFFGIRIRKPVKEIMIMEKRDNLFTVLIDFVSIPFATVGRTLSVKFSKINFIAFIFDFIIEAPFKIFIEVLEDLFSFWREKKEEAYE